MQSPNPLMAQAQTASTTLALAQNRVLRNTYWLLALSMVPTVIGAWLGMQLNVGLMMAAHPAIGFIAFLGIAFGFMFAIQKTKESALGVAVLLGFTLFMGVMLSGLLAAILGLGNGWRLVGLAFGGTAVIFTAMASIATTTRRDLSSLNKFLFVGVILLLIAGFANIFLQLPALTIAFSLIAIAIFSAYMLIDVNAIVTGGETNYISATLRLYLDLFNVFVNLLQLLGIFGGSND